MRLLRVLPHLFLGILAGWLNRHQQAVIDYLKTENDILKRHLNEYLAHYQADGYAVDPR